MMVRAVFIAAFTLFTSTVYGQADDVFAQQGDGNPGVEVAIGECLYCQVGVVSVMLADGVSFASYRCLTDEAQEGDGESEMSYSINLPTAFINAHKITLDSGVSTICIVGGSAIRTEFGKPDYVVIPQNTNIHFVARRTNRQRHLAQTGDRTVLIVRVTAPNSNQSNSAASLANGTFGTGGQQYSMASQYSSCSAGKLSFIAASGFIGQITNGVTELQLNATVNGMTMSSSFENSMITFVKGALGIADLGITFNHIMFCMPTGTISSNSTGWLAYAYVSGYFSFYNNGWCNSFSVKVHEIGHNLGARHSNEAGKEYDDQSCMMGFSYSATESPLMCFNGHKNYIFGWYADKQITVNPETGGAWTGNLVGFVDYAKASPSSRNEYVLIIVGQLYIQYNLAEGFNSGVQEKKNNVTIVTAANDKSMSSMLLSISANKAAVIGSYVIEACAFVAAKSQVPSYVMLSIRLNTQNSTCPGATLVTMNPTSSPTPQPTKLPTAKPTRLATAQPTTATPTSLPTVMPTKTPTWKPTDVPSDAPSPMLPVVPKASPIPSFVQSVLPTLIPSAIPSAKRSALPNVSPTLKPTIFLTVMPTASPTLKPTILPTESPTFKPTILPTESPTLRPTILPTALPTLKPTFLPTPSLTFTPTASPTLKPTILPTAEPTFVPTASPTLKPTVLPTVTPTYIPTQMPTGIINSIVSEKPSTIHPTQSPTRSLTRSPTKSPTRSPTKSPTRSPAKRPTRSPTRSPIQGVKPTRSPTRKPTK